MTTEPFASLTPAEVFVCCARCGAAREGALQHDARAFQCPACGFTFFFNPAVAVAVIPVVEDGRALFIRRAKDPARGRLAMPGGFVDPGETAEAAAVREVREEVNATVSGLSYLTSETNQYHYKGVVYPVLDLFYVGRLEAVDGVGAFDDVESLVWLAPHDVDPADLAFPSMARALAAYGRRVPRPG